ncbi:ABC transporter permease [Streptomyces sp. NPDC093109]|uniref:ABC transporter permease n=1 Tax=Streptomyces sp. NPDC093109 TaxID=3154977 RepID=UPI00344E784F
MSVRTQAPAAPGTPAPAASTPAPGGARPRRFPLRRLLPRRAPAPGLALAWAVVALVLLWALAPTLFTSADPLVGDPGDKLLPPGAGHVFGTDHLGRDLYARVVYGAWLSLNGVAVAVTLSVVVGSLLGLLAGYFGGILDDLVMRLCDVLLAIPSLLLSMAIITVLGHGSVKVAVAVGIAGVAGFARTVRSEVLRVRGTGYVEAARAGGVRPGTVLLRHVVPNARRPAVVLATIEFGTSLLSIAGLSFLGYGEPPPQPEWGALVAGGRDYLETAWWLTTVPGLVVVAVVLSVNRISRERRQP